MCWKFRQTYLLLIIALYHVDTTTDLETGLRKHNVIPRVITSIPPEKCKVIFEWGELIPGMILNKTQVAKKPIVEWNADANKIYTLYMVALTTEDLTHVNNPTLTPYSPEWHQWVVVNIPGMNVENGQELYEYIAAWGPPRPNTTDCYTFLIYEQTRGNTKFQDSRITPMYQFQELSPLSEFSSTYSLGGPLCANYFLMIS